MLVHGIGHSGSVVRHGGRSLATGSSPELENLQAWYDPSDLITLFQDSAMTVPVASDGDPNGAMLDLGPLGLDAIQATTTKRPTYRTSGGESWLELDLIDDALSIEIPSGGLDGTMILATAGGTVAYGASIPEGTFEILRKYYPDDRFYGAVFIDSTATAKQISDSVDFLKAKGGGDDYEGLTSASVAWRDWGYITSFPLVDTSSVTNMAGAWRSCTSLTSFPLIDTSSVTNMSTAWNGCTSLTSFPLIDTSSVTDMRNAWLGCGSLTSFPLIDTSSTKNMANTWRNCTSLASFPMIDTSSVTNMVNTWLGCSSLTSFPLLDTSSVTNMANTWSGCTSLASFPANMFDACPSNNFNAAFSGTALSETSIDDILVSINVAGTSSGTFGQSGGSAPSATGEAAIDAMRGRGWTVTVTGGY